MKIKIKKDGDFWAAASEIDELLMQHCMNEDVYRVNGIGLKKLITVAIAHGWTVEQTDGNKTIISGSIP